MDHRAVAAINKKIRELVDGCEVEGGSFFGAQNRIVIESVSKDVAKHKPLEASEVQAIIYRYLFRSIEKCEGKPTGLLKDLVDGNVLVEELQQRIWEAPYEYSFYFELPSLNIKNNVEFDIGCDSGLRWLKGEDVKGENVFPLDGEPLRNEGYYFQSKMFGYCDINHTDGVLQRALTLLKAFIEMGKDNVLLTENIITRAPQKQYQKSFTYVHELTKDGLINKVAKVEQPPDVALVLRFIQLTSIGIAESDIVTRFARVSQILAKLEEPDVVSSRLLAACEWSFDARAENLPAMQVVKICIGLESIFSDDSFGGITKTLADRCAYLLSNSHAERKKIMERCKDLYALRSKIVHGGGRRLSGAEKDLVMYGIWILSRSIHKEISMFST